MKWHIAEAKITFGHRPFQKLPLDTEYVHVLKPTIKDYCRTHNKRLLWYHMASIQEVCYVEYIHLLKQHSRVKLPQMFSSFITM